MFLQNWRGTGRVLAGKAPVSLLNNLWPFNTLKSISPAISVNQELHLKYMQMLVVRKARQMSTLYYCGNSIARKNQAFTSRLQQKTFCLPIVLKILLPFVYLHSPLLQHKLLSAKAFYVITLPCTIYLCI